MGQAIGWVVGEGAGDVAQGVHALDQVMRRVVGPRRADHAARLVAGQAVEPVIAVGVGQRLQGVYGAGQAAQGVAGVAVAPEGRRAGLVHDGGDPVQRVVAVEGGVSRLEPSVYRVTRGSSGIAKMNAIAASGNRC